MSKGLWIVQILLALAFLGAGMMKIVTPYEELGTQMAWVLDVSPTLVLFIGIAEVAGALGLILPAATRILPWLTPLAAALLALNMLFALIFHLTRSEIGMIVPNIVLGGLAAFVAYGRWKLAPIQARGTGTTAIAVTE